MHTKKITEKGQIWEGFLFLFVIAFVIAGFSYFFIYKFGGVPVIKKPSGGPAERGVLPQGTFFKNTAPKNSEKDKDLLPYQPIKLLGVFGNTARAATIPKRIILTNQLTTNISSSFPSGASLETDTIKIGLSGTNIKNAKDRVFFEYLLLPVDKKWKTTSSKTLNLSRLTPGFYILIVRSRNNSYLADNTPAWLSFRIATSPWYRKVTFSTSGNGKTVSLYNSSKETINITNWKIKSEFGTYAIGQAVRIVDPRLTQVNSDIILQPGGRATLKAATTSLGYSFLPNRCFPFLTHAYKFDFSISGYCNKLSNDEYLNLRRRQFLSESCINFIKSYSCRTPDAKALQRIEKDTSCKNYVLENLNYQSCFQKYHNEADFFSKEWRGYARVTQLFFPRYDRVKLFDAQDLPVGTKEIN